MARHNIYTEIEIEASAEQVWAILVDFASYSQWNPFIRSAEGTPRTGERLKIEVQPSGGKLMSFSPTVLAADPGRELRWLGRLLFPGIFDGEHSFLVEPIGVGKIRFHQSERFSGILVGLLRTSLDGDTKRGFEEMNQALKQRAEQVALVRNEGAK